MCLIMTWIIRLIVVEPSETEGARHILRFSSISAYQEIESQPTCSSFPDLGGSQIKCLIAVWYTHYNYIFYLIVFFCVFFLSERNLARKWTLCDWNEFSTRPLSIFGLHILHYVQKRKGAPTLLIIWKHIYIYIFSIFKMLCFKSVQVWERTRCANSAGMLRTAAGLKSDQWLPILFSHMRQTDDAKT